MCSVMVMVRVLALNCCYQFNVCVLLSCQKYEKMRSMRLPDGAIRQKMNSDGMSGADIASFFGESAPGSGSCVFMANLYIEDVVACSSLLTTRCRLKNCGSKHKKQNCDYYPSGSCCPTYAHARAHAQSTQTQRSQTQRPKAQCPQTQRPQTQLCQASASASTGRRRRGWSKSASGVCTSGGGRPDIREPPVRLEEDDHQVRCPWA
jgi:hypothetical protein